MRGSLVASTARRWLRPTRCCSSSVPVRSSCGRASISSTCCSHSGSRPRLRVALNGVGGPGATARVQLERVMQGQLAERRFALDAVLPWDGRALARAQRTGLPLARVRRRGAYARALSRLLDELFLPVAPTPRERKLPLVAPRADKQHPEKVAVP